MRLLALLFAALALAPAHAGCPEGCARPDSVSTAWSGDGDAPTRFILSNPSHSYGGPIWGAIEIDVADGWFVYALRATEAAAPELDWGGSTNLAPVTLTWPPPAIATIDGNPTAIYHGRVILPISIAPIDTGGDIELKLTFSYAVCGEVCRPSTASHTIRIAAAPLPIPEAAERYARLIMNALRAAGQR